MHHGSRGLIGRVFRHPSLLPALLTLSLSLVPGSRTSAADRFGPAREGGEGPRVTVTTSKAPAVKVRTTAERAMSPLTPIPVPATAPGERSMVMIDAGSPTAVPTESERLKLDAARAAVERARAAGTLFRMRARRADVTPLPSDWQARKLALTRARGPKPFPDDPTAGVGLLPSVQKRGPAGLNAAEEAKRRALPSTSSKDRDPNQGGR